LAFTQDFDFFSANFWQKVVVAGSELSLAPTELTLKTLGPWLGVLFWFILLAIPLSGIQRPQPLTGASYVLFLVASATLLSVMLGRPWVGHHINTATFGILLGAVTLGSWRWQRGSNPSHINSPGAEEKGPPR
jgi:hypothetical protein